MNEHMNQHLPSPEFRVSLEREVVQVFRRQSQFSAPPSVARRARLRTAATLVVGLALGAGGVVASAQVQSSKVRDSLASTAEMKRRLIMMRLEIAEANYEEIKKSVDAGARSRQDLTAAELEMRSAEMAVRHLDLQLEEIKATSAAPRTELWAPWTGKRDFVSEQLKVDAMWTNDKVAAYERALAEARLKVLAGATASEDTLNVRSELSSAERDLEFVAQQLAWRQSFLDKRMDKERIAAEMQLVSVQNQVRTTIERLQQAQARAKRAKDRETVGVGSVLDVKRAELEILESTQELQRAQEQLKRLKAVQAFKKKD